MSRRQLALIVFCVLMVSCALMALLFFPQQAVKKELRPVVSVNSIDLRAFSIVVANCSSNDIKLGSMESVLGMDQFTFEIRTENELIVLTKERVSQGSDPRIPILVPVGGHQSFLVDLRDGSWFCKSTKKVVGPDAWKNTWKAVRVIYKRSASDFGDHRTVSGNTKQYGLLTGEFRSCWIDPQSRRRYREQLGRKLSDEIDEAKRNGNWSKSDLPSKKRVSHKKRVSGTETETDAVKTESKLPE